MDISARAQLQQEMNNKSKELMSLHQNVLDLIDDYAVDVAHAANTHMRAAADDCDVDVVDDHNDVADYSDDDEDEVDVADAANIGGQQRCGRLFQIASHYSSTALTGGL